MKTWNAMLLAAVLVFPGLNGAAQETIIRQSGLEVYAVGSYYGGDTLTAGPVSMEIDPFPVGGIGVGINLSEHFNLGVDAYGGMATVRGSMLGFQYDVESDATVLGMDALLDYNILKTRFTPVLSGAFGFQSWSGDFGNSDSSFGELHWTAAIGAGVRWDPTDHLFVKALYRPTWTQFEDADGVSMFHSASLMIGFRF